MEYHEISKTKFRDEYNISKVLTSKLEIMNYLENYKDDNRHAVAFATKKTPKDTTPIWFKEFEERIEKRFLQIESRLTKIEDRLTKVEDILQRNNLH